MNQRVTRKTVHIHIYRNSIDTSASATTSVKQQPDKCENISRRCCSFSKNIKQSTTPKFYRLITKSRLNIQKLAQTHTQGNRHTHQSRVSMSLHERPTTQNNRACAPKFYNLMLAEKIENTQKHKQEPLPTPNAKDCKIWRTLKQIPMKEIKKKKKLSYKYSFNDKEKSFIRQTFR